VFLPPPLFAQLYDTAEDTNQYVRVDAPFMGFIDDDD
jgi:hypothetical protein